MIVYRATLHVETDSDGYSSIHGIGHFEGRSVLLEIPFPVTVTRAEAEAECRYMRGEQHEGICISTGRGERTGVLEAEAGDGFAAEAERTIGQLSNIKWG